MSVINTNITSMIGQQNLNESKNALTTSMERLSSGLRINSAKDDAAGQAIANRMSAQITGLSTAQRNANDGISVAQTAEGGLNQVNDNLQRVRELTVQAQNGTNSQDDLNSIQNEINQRLAEINRISEETDFNGTKVLGENADATDPAQSTISIQVGANDGQTINIDLQQINAKTLGLEGFNVTGAGEVANEAATLDSLTLAGATQVGTTNEYVLSTDNDPASSLDVLGKAASGDSILIEGTTYTKQDDDSYQYGQAYADTPADAIKTAMQPALGETNTATVTIGVESTDITIASDGNITATDSGNALYLDSTGNLTENGSGTPPAATIDNLSDSLAARSGDSIAITGGATYTTGATVTDLTLSDGTSSTTSAVATALTAEAGGNGDNQAAKLSVTIDGTTTEAYLRADGNLHTSNTTATSEALYFDSNGELSTDTSGSAATATNLAENVSAFSGSVEIVASGTGGADANVGEVYSGNGREVNATELTLSESGVNDVLKAAGNADYTLTLNIEDSAGNTDTQTIDFTVDSNAVTAIEFDTFTDTGGNGDTALGTTGDAVRLSANDDSLTSDATTDVSYFAQENGNITNDSGQRIYQDADSAFTTDATTESERSSLSELDSALNMVDSLRSDLGAVQNRFESAIENLSTNETNLSAARSRIEDADYAVEVANMTKNQILQQAGTSVLAQANQLPQSVLSLLG
jgi:flagellin